MCGSGPGVPRRVWTLCLDEMAQELNQLVSVLIDSGQKRFLLIGHNQSPLLIEMKEYIRKSCKLSQAQLPMIIFIVTWSSKYSS